MLALILALSAWAALCLILWAIAEAVAAYRWRQFLRSVEREAANGDCFPAHYFRKD